MSGPAFGVELRLPEGAQLTAEDLDVDGVYALPIGVWQRESAVPTEARPGRVLRQAWRLGGNGQSSYQILLGLRQQIVDAGYSVVFDCENSTCGGFDFRFGIQALGEPQMHVDLGDYQFLSAVHPEDPSAAVSLLVSRSASAGYVQVVAVTGADAPEPSVDPQASTKAEPGSALPGVVVGDIGQAMEDVGRFILADLVFATGSSELGPGDYGSLTELAAYLAANPTKRVALVGHTDAEGSLAGNVALSKRRAASVMARLVRDFGVAPGQLEADGIGYLAPIASNQSDDGRRRNRRVEAILVSTK